MPNVAAALLNAIRLSTSRKNTPNDRQIHFCPRLTSPDGKRTLRSPSERTPDGPGQCRDVYSIISQNHKTPAIPGAF